MKWFGLTLALLVCGCVAKAPSDAIVDIAYKEVASVQQTLKTLENQTPPECKTDIFIAHLEAIDRQVTVIGGQIESIGLACQTEKSVLEERIVGRNVMIACLALLLLIMGWFLIRK